MIHRGRAFTSMKDYDSAIKQFQEAKLIDSKKNDLIDGIYWLLKSWICVRSATFFKLVSIKEVKFIFLYNIVYIIFNEIRLLLFKLIIY